VAAWKATQLIEMRFKTVKFPTSILMVNFVP
jgi:hypothetical protein